MQGKIIHQVVVGISLLIASTVPMQAKESGGDISCEHCGQTLSQAFISVAQKGRPAVVHIRASVGPLNENVPDRFRNEPFNPFEEFQEELFNRFFGVPSGKEKGGRQRMLPESTGSGFLVSSNGYIVTNHHVVKDATKILVERYDEVEKEFEAQLIGCDPSTDIAILKISGEDLPYLEFGDSDKIQAGQWTMAIGHPFKLRDSVTVGVISATHRGDLQISNLEDFIQTDTPINPGNSGGPLIDLSGKVIGVNTAILSRSGGSISIGFAIPSNMAKMVYEQIKQNGCVDRAFLGVQIQDLTEELVMGFRLKKGTTGALISDVVPDSSASQAGLQPGDIVIEFNKESVKSAKQLYTNLGKLPSGTTCSMKVLRDGKEKKVEITLGSRAKDVSEAGDIIHKMGLIVEQITPENAHKFGMKTEDKGVVITKVLPNSTAAKMGWTAGSVIMVVNGEKISSIADLKKAIEMASPKDRLVVLMNAKGRASFHSIPHPLS